MLLQLEIKNFAIIDHTRIDFEKGFNVLTGETGAGKSILIDALAAILGERTSKEYIRKEKEKAELKAVFTKTKSVEKKLQALGVSIQDDIIILERHITKSGRSLAKINGSIQTSQVMKEVAEQLIEICGQKEHQQLIKENHYVALLDELSGEEHGAVVEKYTELYKRLKVIEKELDEVVVNQREQEQLLDLYKFQKKEIEEAKLTSGECEQLESEKKVLASYEKIATSLGNALQQFEVLDDLHTVQKSLEEAAKFEDKMEEISERFEKAWYELKDIKEETERYFHNMEYDEQKLYDIMNRLEVYKNMKRKYGDTIEEIETYQQEITQKIDNIENKEEKVEQLEKEKKKLMKEMTQLSTQMHETRMETAENESKKINKEIHELCMPYAKLVFNAEETNEFTLVGKTKISALFSANKGEDLKQLSKVASGGELSRILLGIKIASNVESEKVLFFDEVDEGVGGEVGRIIGEKLYNLGMKTQVVTISHLPQVAAKGDTHYVIEKSSDENRTVSRVKKLTTTTRVDEIARMIYGDHADSITRKQAEEMLKK